ncbi:unnamed protein product [Protopolystoma xenopodis]|uniref:Ig-like domain-containing protein n=1 Tax=Protopolystoma xenopodis TaxID=117903 RepID=A0A448WSC1_9PLAT|nr:unnamed protein product [Protopolystoma xenopodis]
MTSSAASVSIEQSDVCRPAEIEEGIQCLSDPPASSYKVCEGESVLMRCKVANQKGKARWRAKDMLLGKSLSQTGQNVLTV